MSSSQSAWEAAVFAGAAPRLETMLRNDPTLANVRLTAGQRALHMAARLSNDRVAALLINVPVTDVDAQDDVGNAPLHVAASVAADAIVRMLIKAGATVDVRNALGETPLFAAAMLGNEAAVTLLVEAGADENWYAHRHRPVPYNR